MRSRKDGIFNELEHIHEVHLRLLEHLLEDENDTNFFEEYYMDDEVAKSSIYDFRINQRFRKSITKSQFIKLYKVNKKEALEKLFQEPLTNDDVNLFVQADKPLGEVYKLSNEHCHLQLHSLLHLWDFVKDADNVSDFRDSSLD